MADLRDRLEDFGARGQRRGVDAIAEAALTEAASRRDGTHSRQRSRQVRWRVAAGIAAAIALVAVVVVVNRSSGHRTTVSTPPPPAPTAQLPADAHGWFFDNGEVRDLVTNRVVARFPDKIAPEVPPARVAGGFAAVTSHSSVGDLWLSTSPDVSAAVHIASSVSGVAASRDGRTIAYAIISAGGVGPTTLVIADVATNAVRSSALFPKFARVVGFSDPEVVLETGDGGGAAAALWMPSSGQIVALDGYGGTGGVGRGYAVLHEGDGICPVLVSIADMTVHPQPKGDTFDPACSTSRWSLDPNGTANAVGFGVLSSPLQLRIARADGSTSVSAVHASDAIWVDDATIAAIDDRGQLVTCDVGGHCEPVRQLASPPSTSSPSSSSSFGSQWLISGLPGT